jgi:hypothetical protein
MSNTAAEKPPVAEPAPEATKDWYAWTRIHVGSDVDEHEGSNVIIKRHFIEPGDKVTKKDLGVDDEEWDSLVAERVVRRSKYPTKMGQYESPKRYLIKQAAKNMEIAQAGGES